MNEVFCMFASGGISSFFHSFSRSDFAGKVIVLALLGFSFLAWTVMIGKYLDLKRLRDLNFLFFKKINQMPTLLNLEIRSSGAGQGAYARLLAAAIDTYYTLSRDENVKGTMLMKRVESAIHRVLAEQALRYQSKMVILGSIVTGSPFLGLLGTVWGVMDAFGAMGGQTSVTLQSLAPGVSGALLTTVAGLMVAIPSVFGYNFLLTYSKVMTTELENFASFIADRIELEIQ